MERHYLLENLSVGDIWRLVVESPASVTPDESVLTALQKVIEDTRTRHLCVVNEMGRLIGEVRMTTLVEQLFPFDAMMEEIREGTSFFRHVRIGAKTVREIMNDQPYFVTKDTKLGEMARILIREKINELTVIDDDMQLIGQVNMYEVISAYLKAR